MTTLATIDTAARKYAACRTDLANRLTVLNDELEQVKRRHMTSIKHAVEATKDNLDNLRDQIADAPDLFAGKRRTLILHGIKVGYRKGSGKLTIEDPARTLALIDKHLADQRDLLILVEEKPNKDAISQLAAADLKKIGCTIEDTGDQIVIKGAASEVDKLVDAMLKEKTDEAAAA